MKASEVLENVEVDKREMHYLIKGITSKQKMSDTLKDILKLVEHAEMAGEETAVIRIERLGEVVILQEPKETYEKRRVKNKHTYGRKCYPGKPIWW